jgi:hypothetical protein
VCDYAVPHTLTLKFMALIVCLRLVWVELTALCPP